LQTNLKGQNGNSKTRLKIQMSNSQIGNYNQNLKVEMENTNKVEGQIGKYKQG